MWSFYSQKYIDYYQVIKEPIDLRLIAQKIQSNGYVSLDDMQKDLFLMLQNAKTFNKQNSTIYKVRLICAILIRNHTDLSTMKRSRLR